MDSSFKDLSYHPKWEHYHFDKEQYQKLLQDIAAKENLPLYRCDHTLRVATLIEGLWHTIIGWLGFEDRTNVIKVNYEFMKILRYGESHHFLEDGEIRKTLTLVQKNLTRDHAYRRIGQIIERLLNTESGQETPADLINHRIDLYYSEHQDRLREAFWPRLFHRYIAPLQRDAALVHFNMGRIYLNEQNCEKAILSFQSALEIDPEYPDCLLNISRALLIQGEQLHQQQQWVDALRLYDKTLLSLQMIDVKKLNPSEATDINDLIIKAYLFKFAVEIKINKFKEGIDTLKTVGKASGTSIEHYLQNYHRLVTSASPLSLNDFQLGSFYVQFANELPFNKALPYLSRAEEVLTKLIKAPNRPQEAYPSLIQAHLKLAAGFFSEKQFDKAEVHYSHASAVFSESKDSFPENLRSIISNEIFSGYEQLAQSLENEKTNLGAIRIYQQLKALFAQDHASKAKCCSEIAKLYEREGNYAAAWKEIEEACKLDSKESYTLQLKDLAIKTAQREFIERHYAKSELYWNKVLEIEPENHSAFHGLALTYFEMENDEKTEFFLKKALAVEPQDCEMVFLKGVISDEKGHYAEALQSYHSAHQLDEKNPTYRHALVLASIKAGDRIYARGSCRPESVQQAILDFIEFIQASTFSKKIEAALGAWKGNKSQENKEFQQLGQNVKDPDDIERQGKRALELIQKAFDGKSNHLSPSEMPSEFNERMQILNQQISQMIAYYSSLREATEEFVKSICQADYYKEIEHALGSWIGSLSTDNTEFRNLGKRFVHLDQVEPQLKRALQLIEKAYNGQKPHLQPHQMPAALREKIESLRALLAPTMTANEAIPHYLKAFELAPNEYQDYLNRLIDSYIRVNDHKQAIEWYEKLVQKFPHYPIWINPEAYLKTAEVLLSANKFNDSIKLIRQAIEMAPNRALFRKALSHAYFLIGEGFQKKQNNMTKALEYYQNALNCGVEAEGACYSSLADYYEKQVTFAPNHTMKNNLIEQLMQHRKKAAELEPNNAEFQYQYGRLIYHEDLQQRVDAVPYLENAVALDPNNVTYLHGLIMAMRKRCDGDAQIDPYLNRFKALGGIFAKDYWEPII